MDEENQAISDMGRAARAQAIVENELFTGAFEFVRKEVYDRWKGCSDAEQRDRLWQATNVIDRVEHVLRMHIENGKVAKADLDRLQGLRSRRAA